jgi:hypothetical protein
MPNEARRVIESSPGRPIVAPAPQQFSFKSAAKALILVLLFTSAAVYEEFRLSALVGLEVWSHLRTGIWILQNRAVPRDGLFSQYPELPWIAHSWGFDTLVAAAFGLAGLRALPLLLMAFEVALAVALFWLARGSWRNFWPAVTLAAVAQHAIPVAQLQPGLCSMLFLAVELALLFDARRTGYARLLWWLPLLFALWANLHIQFLYGLFVLVLFLVAVLAEAVCRHLEVHWIERGGQAISLSTSGAAIAGAFIATLLPPYSYHLYEVMPRFFVGPISFRYLPEHYAVGFRQPRDFVLLLLAMTAFFLLGRRHSRDFFQLALLLSAAMVSFSTQRDCWVVAIVSVAVITDALPVKLEESAPSKIPSLWRPQNLVTAGLVLLTLLVATITKIPSRREVLMADVAKALPVGACDYIRSNHLPGPLFNAYEWGGFLTWYLPEYPVVIDGRLDLYGEDINVQYMKLTHAQIPLNSDEHFLMAGTLLLETDSPMAVALSTGPRFIVAYKDSVATVLADLSRLPRK